MSASESLFGGQFTLSTQSIKPNYFVIFPPVQHHSFFRNLAPLSFFTTIAVNLAIWSANLPLSIRVHTTLLASMCCTMPFQPVLWKNVFFDVVVKSKSKCGLSWSVLLLAMSTSHYSFPKHFFLIFSACWASLQRERKEVWCVQVAHLHNAACAVSSPNWCLQWSTNLGKDFFHYLLILW